MATKILYVDDNADALTYIEFMLKRRGYSVMTACSAKDAFLKAKNFPPDLFLIEVLMSEVDGYQLTEAIRADPELKYLPVILFSAASTPEHKARGHKAGADDYLTKPILNDELDKRIQASLKLTQIRRQAKEISAQAPEERSHQEQPMGESPIQVISVCGSKGGVGATTLLVNTAVALSQTARVIIADLNVGLGSIVLQLGLKATTVPRSPWTMRPEEITDRAILEAIIPHSENLHVILMSEGEYWSPTTPLVETVLGHLRPMADYILLDLGAGITATRFPLLICSDHTVLVSGADRIASALAENALNAIIDLRIPREQISVVMVQRRDTTGRLTPELLERHLQMRLDAVIPVAQADALWAYEQGTPVVTTLPESPLAQSYFRFAQKLQDKRTTQGKETAL